MARDRILVTGGLGYIGSHTVVELIAAGYEPVIIDNLSNSSPKVLKRLEKITGRRIIFEQEDIRHTKKLGATLAKYQPAAVIHFAALKSISESVEKPLEYYANNIGGTISLLQAMTNQRLDKIIFSSSAVVYGDITEPATEDMPFGQTNNPYGATKIQCERLLQDVAAAENDWSITILRYFNPIGAHPSGLIGESPSDIPNNLMPYVTQVAAGQLKELRIYGDDYPTPDGTGIRDFIHVVDLARGHVAALKKLTPGVSIYNLGTGRGNSVKQVIEVFERTTGRRIPHTIVARRPGDLPDVTADPSKALRELGWRTELDLADMCRDAWNWQSRNPLGY